MVFFSSDISLKGNIKTLPDQVEYKRNLTEFENKHIESHKRPETKQTETISLFYTILCVL